MFYNGSVRLIVFILFFPALFCGNTYAKETLDIKLGGYYERSRLARSSDSASNFSLQSNAGWKSELVLDKYFTSWWILTLGGSYSGHTYEGSAARIINNENPSLSGGVAGFKFVAGDFKFFTLYEHKNLVLLLDEATNIHNLETVGIGNVVAGFQFAAISRYWDLAFEARGGSATEAVEFQNLELKQEYFVEGSAMIIFGRTNKTLFEVISLKNLIGSETLVGLQSTVREESYSYGDDKYTLTNFSAGLFLKFIF